MHHLAGCQKLIVLAALKPVSNRQRQSQTTVQQMNGLRRNEDDL
ncbi:MAG TPA: hypothetical protein PLA68_00110 [Panacibacter sp.]|nr:hypothetical protein [Panacibacter sp.]